MEAFHSVHQLKGCSRLVGNRGVEVPVFPAQEEGIKGRTTIIIRAMNARHSSRQPGLEQLNATIEQSIAREAEQVPPTSEF